jgi:hypothetical protein
MHSGGKKRRSFVALLITDGDLRRYARKSLLRGPIRIKKYDVTRIKLLIRVVEKP